MGLASGRFLQVGPRVGCLRCASGSVRWLASRNPFFDHWPSVTPCSCLLVTGDVPQGSIEAIATRAHSLVCG